MDAVFSVLYYANVFGSTISFDIGRKTNLDEGEKFNNEDVAKKEIEMNECPAVVFGEAKHDLGISQTKDVEPGALTHESQVSSSTTDKKEPDCEHSKELTESFTDPETESMPKDPTEHSSAQSRIPSWTERRKRKKEMKLGRDTTYKSFLEESRKFNLDLAPKLLFSRGSLVESLISANIAHYAEFKVVTRILTCMNGTIEEVPCSRSDVFGSELISVLEKRALMRFITFCANFEEFPKQYLEFEDKPFIDYLKSRKLTPNLQHIITCAIAAVPENTTTLFGLKATQKFLQSLGRYGNTPFLWSLYGSGELPQAFCRMCAVFGGIYCLRKNVNCMVLDEGRKRCVGVISEDGQRLNTKWLIMEKSYAPEIFEIESQSMISRAILITDKSLKPSSREHLTLLTLPGISSSVPVRVIELGPSSMACPKSLFVVHFIAESSSTAIEDLDSYVKQLFTTPDEEKSDDEKPAVLWAMYFNRKCFTPIDSDKIPENVKLTSLPSLQLDFEDAMEEAKTIFTSICPDKEFLEAVPNPEDIIWDDIINTPSTEKEPVKEEQLLADSKENGEETFRTDGDITNRDGSKQHSMGNTADDGNFSGSAEQSGKTTLAEHGANISGIQTEVTSTPTDNVGSSRENTGENSSVSDHNAGSDAHAQETISI